MQERVKVAQVTLSLQAGGVERIICNLVSSPVMEGLPVVVCCLDEEGVLAGSVQASGARVVVLHRQPGIDLGLIPRLIRFFRQQRVTVVHTHSLDPMFYAGWAAWLAGVPIRIHTQHLNIMDLPYRQRDRRKFRWAARAFSRIVAINADIDRSLEAVRVPSHKRMIILNGIDEDRFSRPRESSRAPNPSEDPWWTIGTVARLAPQKAIHRLLEAFSVVHAKHANSRLLIVGDGPLRGELEAYTARLNLSAAVEFLGFREDVQEVLRQFDVFVLPSLFEGLPLALLEAMAARLPVIATAVGGVPEVVVHGESGILIPPDNATALAEALLDLMTHPDKRAKLASSAETRVREHFSLSAMARAYRRLYLADPPERAWARVVKKYFLRALPRRWMLWQGRRDCAQVALTFDDGPDPTYTPRILEILRRCNAKATFFLIGEKAARERQLVCRIAEEGHEIGNHSYSHPQFESLSWKQAVAEIAETRTLLEGLQGRECRLFRPPRIKLCLTSILGAWLRRMTVVMCSRDLKDFRAEDPDEINTQLAADPISNGDIILYHGHNPAALNALPKVIECALGQGRRAVTVSEMLT
jgi:sugar transferase (PEP-CTERM/EpsH1 system associated)